MDSVLRNMIRDSLAAGSSSCAALDVVGSTVLQATYARLTTGPTDVRATICSDAHLYAPIPMNRGGSITSLTVPVAPFVISTNSIYFAENAGIGITAGSLLIDVPATPPNCIGVDHAYGARITIDGSDSATLPVCQVGVRALAENSVIVSAANTVVAEATTAASDIISQDIQLSGFGKMTSNIKVTTLFGSLNRAGSGYVFTPAIIKKAAGTWTPAGGAVLVGTVVKNAGVTLVIPAGTPLAAVNANISISIELLNRAHTDVIQLMAAAAAGQAALLTK